MLVDGTLGSDLLFPCFSGESTLSDVTTGVGAVSSEPPDDTGNPPGEATTTSGAAKKTTADASEGWADHHEDSSEASSSARSKDLDETPEEPSDEALVHVSDLSCVCSGG